METRTQHAVDLYTKEKLNCAQAVALTYADLLSLDEKQVKSAMYGFGHGMGGRLGTCGAISGAVYLSSIIAEQKQLNQQDTYAISAEITKRFDEKTGSIICQELKDPKSKYFTSCLQSVRIAAQITEDLLFTGMFEK